VLLGSRGDGGPRGGGVAESREGSSSPPADEFQVSDDDVPF